MFNSWNVFEAHFANPDIHYGYQWISIANLLPLLFYNNVTK